MFIAHMRDGKTLTEKEVNWKQIDVQNVTSLQLSKHGRFFTVGVDGKNVKLIQLKRNVLDLLKGTDFVTERVIGFVIEDKYAVKMEIDERTGNAKLTLEKKEGKKWHRL